MKNNQHNNNLIRINKFLAQCGIASRRKCEELILAGRVYLNGKAVSSLGTKINPNKDKVSVDGKRVCLNFKNNIVIKLYKPKYIVSTMKDDKGRPSLKDLLPKKYKNLIPIGRLDFESEGLVLFTNDGEWANKMLHPKYQTVREYIVHLDDSFNKKYITKLIKGIKLKEGIAKATKVEILKNNKSASIIKIALTEGKNRQIRRMLSSLNLKVTRLIRTRHGRYTLGKLKPGELKIIKK